MEALVAVKVAQLVGAAICLSVGFWVGKKLTNRIDYFIYTHSKEFAQQKEKFLLDRKMENIF